jgi:D-beta-D-heptose 7-phosphate kinase/D-beta-D-heptose 1-phosphate adenosyltransferase
MRRLSAARLDALLQAARRTRILVVGDLMLDQFIWGRVERISPEAPVPVVEFDHESCMPGGAANVARNLTALGARVEMFGVVGRDAPARQLRALLRADGIEDAGVIAVRDRGTSIKTRIIASQQQVVRLDRETNGPISPPTERALLCRLDARLPEAAAVIVGDYGKGVLTQPLLDALRERCRPRGLWLSLDPKPVHSLDLRRLSLITPNRRELFALAGVADTCRHADPLQDGPLREAVERCLQTTQSALLLVTLGEHGMLLCRREHPPFHIPTVAREVFDVSGAGDTVIAAFTLAVAAGASPVEAALVSNLAAGLVVGKVGTAVVTPEELRVHRAELAGGANPSSASRK